MLTQPLSIRQGLRRQGHLELLGVKLVRQLLARGLHIAPVDRLILGDGALQPAALR
jgi:hypothetical protein